MLKAVMLMFMTLIWLNRMVEIGNKVPSSMACVDTDWLAQL